MLVQATILAYTMALAPAKRGDHGSLGALQTVATACVAPAGDACGCHAIPAATGGTRLPLERDGNPGHNYTPSAPSARGTLAASRKGPHRAPLR
jgi:hypothetical protein